MVLKHFKLKKFSLFLRLNSHFPHLSLFSFSHFKSANSENSLKQFNSTFHLNSSSTSINTSLSNAIDGSLNNTVNNHMLSSAATIANFNTTYRHSIDSISQSKLHSSISCQEFYAKHNLHHSNSNSTMNLGFHFHLAGLINAENGKFNFYTLNL